MVPGACMACLLGLNSSALQVGRGTSQEVSSLSRSMSREMYIYTSIVRSYCHYILFGLAMWLKPGGMLAANLRAIDESSMEQ